MAVVIPTRRELYDQIIAELETELGIKITQTGKSPLRAYATVQAGKLHLYWQAIAMVLKNIFPDTADPEQIGGTLGRFGRAFLNRSPFAAVQGIYVVQVSGQVGAVIPAGQLFQSNDSATNPGRNFVLDTEKTLSSITDTITLRALQAGTESQLNVGDLLTSTSPLLNVNDEVNVLSETQEPSPEETTENYRAAILRAIRQESQGGAATDYRVWANDAQNIRFVYPYTTSGQTSQIDLYIEATQASSTDGKGTPTAAQITNVTEVINFDPDTTLANRGRRPLLAVINYLSVSPQDVVIDVNGSTIGASNQTSIRTLLVQLIDDIRPFVDAADFEPNRNDRLSITQIIATIQGVLTGNEIFTGVTLTVGGNPVTTSIQFTAGDIPFLDSADVNFNP